MTSTNKKSKDGRPTIVADIVIPPLPSTTRGLGLHMSGNLVKSPRLLYCALNTVVQRNIENVNDVLINSESPVAMTVAKYSPSGEWICSGDITGKTTVWANKSFVIKNTIQIGKSCLDIAWDGEGKRIAACGAGKDDKGKVFPWNTNNKLGILTGSSKDLLTCDFRPKRPFFVVAGGADFSVFNYKGPPFKFQTYDGTHSNYVNCIRFRPAVADADVYLSVSSDKNIHVFDAKSGKKTRAIKSKKGHKGSIYEVCWSPDGSRFMTASADKTCKIWNYESGEVEHTFKFADKPQICDMQVSCLWLEGYMFSISLSGRINYLHPDSERPVRILTGHKKKCNDLVVDFNLGQVYTCDVDGRVCCTNYKSGLTVDVVLAGGGAPHGTSQLRRLALSSDSQTLYTMAVDDTLCLSPTVDLAAPEFQVYANKNTKVAAASDTGNSNSNSNSADNTADADENKDADANDENSNGNSNSNSNYGNNDASKYSAKGKVLKLPGAGRFVLCANTNPNICYVGTHNSNLLVLDGLNVSEERKIDFEPSCGALSPDDKYLAIGEQSNDNQFHIYDVEAKQIHCTVKNEYMRGVTIECAFSWDGKYLATTDRNRHIWIWDFENMKFDEPMNSKSTFQFHLAIVNCLEWSRDSKRLVSCGHDGIIHCWVAPTEGNSLNTKLENSFNGAISKIGYLNEDTLVGVGVDATVRFFKIVENAKK